MSSWAKKLSAGLPVDISSHSFCSRMVGTEPTFLLEERVLVIIVLAATNHGEANHGEANLCANMLPGSICMFPMI